jgi:hypothetical protein
MLTIGSTETIFTTLLLLHNLLMGPISYGVTLRLAGNASQGVII